MEALPLPSVATLPTADCCLAALLAVRARAGCACVPFTSLPCRHAVLIMRCFHCLGVCSPLLLRLSPPPPPPLLAQVLGRVYPHAAHKSSRQARDVVPQFKEAAQARPRNADIWELLGDLLASLEPAGVTLWRRRGG